MIIKTMKTIQHEFKEYDPDCVNDSHNDAMNWLLSFLHNIRYSIYLTVNSTTYTNNNHSTNNSNNTRKQLKQCHPDDILSLGELLKIFCSIRKLSIPDIDSIRNNDAAHKQSYAFVLKDTTITKKEPAAITLDKLVLHTSLRTLRISSNEKSESNIGRYSNITINPKKGRRWSRIKLTSL